MCNYRAYVVSKVRKTDERLIGSDPNNLRSIIQEESLPQNYENHLTNALSSVRFCLKHFLNISDK